MSRKKLGIIEIRNVRCVQKPCIVDRMHCSAFSIHSGIAVALKQMSQDLVSLVNAEFLMNEATMYHTANRTTPEF